jgi:hypothetical protein
LGREEVQGKRHGSSGHCRRPIVGRRKEGGKGRERQRIEQVGIAAKRLGRKVRRKSGSRSRRASDALSLVSGRSNGARGEALHERELVMRRRSGSRRPRSTSKVVAAAKFGARRPAALVRQSRMADRSVDCRGRPPMEKDRPSRPGEEELAAALYRRRWLGRRRSRAVRAPVPGRMGRRRGRGRREKVCLRGQRALERGRRHPAGVAVAYTVAKRRPILLLCG